MGKGKVLKKYIYKVNKYTIFILNSAEGDQLEQNNYVSIVYSFHDKC